MIPFEEALKIVLNSAYTLGNEQVDITNSLNRILAEDVSSDIEIPPFNKSAMDGYACRKEDLKNELEEIEVIPAGKIPQKAISKNQCSKIMTGAMVPEGADCVIMVEHTEITADNKIRFTGDITKAHICYKGEDVKTGDIVLKKGILLKPQHIAVLASVGCVKPLVVKQPSIGIISTGSELVEPHLKPGLSQIRNSNAYQLISQVTAMGAIPNYIGIAGDSEDVTYNAIIRALHDNDVIILTGGVSMGDFDFVPEILKKAGFRLLFKKIAIQPGKPTVFGLSNNKFCFGLPGNPVSSFVLFELLVKPILYKMMGTDHSPLNIKMPLSTDYKRRESYRLLWIPVIITEEGEVMPVEYHGSAHIHSLSQAHGMISLPVGKASLKKGEIVDVRQI
ncbi:MAG: gephyrin-like molybdotransferase Glp [Bacteroidota bacterium]